MNKPRIYPRRALVAVLLVLALTKLSASPVSSSYAIATSGTTGEVSTKPAQEARESTEDVYGKLPLSFEMNHGQADPKVKFISRGDGYNLLLTSDEAVFHLASAAPASSKRQPGIRRPTSAVLKMKMLGANPSPRIEGQGRMPGTSNYFIGADSSRWQTGVPNYERVLYGGIYPGVDLVYYGIGRELEYDFHVAPGANPDAIKLGFKGARRIRICEDGGLEIGTAAGDVRMKKPFIYQENEGARQEIKGGYILLGKNRVGFKVTSYDKDKPLIIDPVLSYSTFLGGTSFDEGRSIAIDSQGNAYVTGRTSSFNFPITIDSYDTTLSQPSDVFVTKIDATGSGLVYSTYIGGENEDAGFGITLDSSGNVYVTGTTSSNDYPTTPGAFRTAFGGGCCPGDAFVTKLNATGADLVYSTFLGGFSSDQGNAIALDSFDNAYITGFTNSSNFPISPGAFQTIFAGGGFPTGDAFISKLNSTGTDIVYSTFLGGIGADQGSAIKVDGSGNAYIVGATSSTDFDVTPGAFQTIFGGSDFFFGFGDAFATKLNATGTALIYSTYLGGARDDAGSGLALSSSGEAYITGFANSANFPTTPGVLKVLKEGVARTNNSGASWSASNSGLIDFNVRAFAIDPSNSSVVFAATQGGIFKSTDGGSIWSHTSSGLTDLFLRSAIVHPANSSLVYLGTSSRGVFRSTDSGATWRAINTGQGGMQVNALKIDPVNASIIYAGTDRGVFKTTNGGASWAEANTGLGFGGINTLAIDPVTPSVLYAGRTFSGVYKSTNGGANWNATALNQDDVQALAIDPTNTAVIYAGRFHGVLRSTDAGNSWSNANVGLTNRIVNALAVEQAGLSAFQNDQPSGAIVIYAGTDGGVFKSTDGANTWSEVNSGLTGTSVNTLAIDPVSPNIVFAGSITRDNPTDAFVSKLNATGTGLVYSTFLGGISQDQGVAITIDPSDNAFVTGLTNSRNFPTTRGSFSIFNSFSTDVFVSKLNATGTGFGYSTFLGGFDTDQGFGIAVDSSGGAYVTGITSSSNFPLTPGAFQTILGGSGGGFSSDAFIAKLLPAPALTSDLEISVSAPASITAGSGMNYDILVTNEGPDTAFGIVINSDLSPAVTVNHCSTSTGSCNFSLNSVTFTIPSLEPGVSATATIFSTVNCSIPQSTIINNTVTVESSGFDLNPDNDSATVTTTATNPETTLNPPEAAFSAAATSTSVQVNRGANCPWTSSSNASWLTINFSSNFGNGSVFYNVAANTGARRIGTMTIAGITFKVTQEGSCNIASIDPGNESFAGNGGAGQFNVTAPTGCNWTAFSNNPSFITITSGSGSGNGTVTFSVAPNPGSAVRTGTINVGDQTFTVFQGVNFADVPQDHPFYTEIGKLSARGVTLGCDVGLYCPSDTVLRDQMAAFIIRALGDFNPPPPVMQRFDDVRPSHPFYAFIEQMAVRQITLGCDVNLYCPSDPVTREQMAAFIIRALGEFDPPEPAMQRFLDVLPSNPFYRFIDRMAVLEITLGCGGGNYCPSDPVTRGQMAAFLVRAFDL